MAPITFELAPIVDALGLRPLVDGVLGAACGSCPEFLTGSDFLKKLHAAGHVLGALDPAHAKPVPCVPATALGSLI